jgi:hypothetical protein
MKKTGLYEKGEGGRDMAGEQNCGRKYIGDYFFSETIK